MQTWYSGGSVRGNIVAPPSKEQTFRAVFLSSLAFGKSIVRNPLLCDDTQYLIDALREFNVPIDERNGDLYITGGYLRAPPKIDCGCSEGALKILASFCSIFHKEIAIGTSCRTSTENLFEGLRQLGVSCNTDPISVKGPAAGGEIALNGDDVSDTISSLMMTAPLMKEGLRIRAANDNISRSDIAMTESIMSKFDVPVFYENDSIRIGYGGYKPAMFNVSGDYGAAAYYMVAAAISGTVSVYGLEPNDVQSGKMIERILREAGADVSRVTNATVVKQDALMGRSIDAGNIPYLVPLLAVLCSASAGNSTITGLSASQMQIVEETISFIDSIGGRIQRTEDGCSISGVCSFKGGIVESNKNAHVAMAAAVASLMSDSEITVRDSECIGRSYPNFNNDLRSIGVKVE